MENGADVGTARAAPPLVRFVLSLYSAELIRLAKNHALSRASAKCSPAFFKPYFCIRGRTVPG